MKKSRIVHCLVRQGVRFRRQVPDPRIFILNMNIFYYILNLKEDFGWII